MVVNVDSRVKKDREKFAQFMRDVYRDTRNVLDECARREHELREDARRYRVNIDDDYWYV